MAYRFRAQFHSIVNANHEQILKPFDSLEDHMLRASPPPLNLASQIRHSVLDGVRLGPCRASAQE